MKALAFAVATLLAIVPAFGQVQPGGGGCTATAPCSVVVIPSVSAGITSVVSAALENGHVLKNTAGNMYSVYVSNVTGGTTGFLEIFNATSAPADGAVTPRDCAPVVGGVAQIVNANGLPPSAYSTGIVAVISSSTTCFTKTTGVLTGFINGKVQ